MLDSASCCLNMKPAADAPIGSSVREAAIASASMVRTSRIGFVLPGFSKPERNYHSLHQSAVVDFAQVPVTALRLPICPADNFHQFSDLAALIGFVVAADRVFHAIGHVIPENFLLDTAQSRPDRGDLGDDIDAVTVLVDHLREAANLAFDTVQPFLTRRLDVFSHGSYIPP
jgi:hypothetical protein